MRLGSEVVDLSGPDLLKETVEGIAVREITVVEEQPSRFQVRVEIQVVDAFCAECRRTPDHAVHLVPLRQQVLGKIRTVLASYPGNERSRHLIPRWQLQLS